MSRRRETSRSQAKVSLVTKRKYLLAVGWGVRQLGEVQGQVVEPFPVVYSEGDFVMGALHSHVLAVTQSMDDE